MMYKKTIWNDNPFDQWTEEELLCMEFQGICHGKGGGSAPPPPTSTQTVQQTTEFPTELRPFISDIFEKGQAIQEQRQEEGFQPELTQQLAGFTPEQETSFTELPNIQRQTQPLFEEATQLSRGAARAATDPAEVAALMNPFLRNVTDIEKREAERVADVQEQQLASQAAQAGAFGGSRAAILEAERQRNLNQQLGDIEARGRLAAFQDAQNRLQNQFGREAATAAQLGALGAAIPAQRLKEIGALSGVGAARQQQAQRALDIATQQAREEFGFPMQTLQDFSSILRGFPLPATTNVSRQTFSPAQPLATQLLGLGTGLAGLAGAAGAFKKAGGRVGSPAPIGLKNGGYIKLAGGGGLGQLMQEKLPSNRVRMGKTAYQDVSRVPVSPVASIPFDDDAVFTMTQEILNILQNKGEAGLVEIQEKYPREVVNFALSEYQSQQGKKAPSTLLKDSKKLVEDADRVLGMFPFNKVAGDIVTEQIAEQTRRPTVQIPSAVGGDKFIGPPTALDVGRNIKGIKSPEENNLLQRAVGSLDRLVTDSDSSSGLPFPVKGVKPSPGGSYSSATVPISMSQLLADHRDRNRAAPPAAVDEIDMTTAFTAGVSPDVSPPNLMSAPAAFDEPVDIATALTAGVSPNISSPNLMSAASPSILSSVADSYSSPADLSQNYPRGYTPEGIKSLEKYNPTFAQRGPQLDEEVVATEKLGFSPETRSSVRAILGGTREGGRNPFQRLAHITGADEGLTEGFDFFATLGEGATKAIGSLGEVREVLKTPQFVTLDADVREERKKLIAEEEKRQKFIDDIDQSVERGKEVKKENIFDAEGPPSSTDAAKKAAAPTTTTADAAPTTGPDGGPAMDGADVSLLTGEEPKNPARVAAVQADFDQQVADIKGKDYSDDIKKMLGDAPTYEKGEEPDFAARKWLALANFGAGILASGGGKTLAQSIGEAAKPALKELADIGKEERKIKKELRQERNAQKRADYQDDLQRFNLQRQLRSDDLDAIKMVANISQKEEQLQISRKNAESARATAIASAGLQRLKTDTLVFDNFMKQKGFRTLDEVRKELDSYKQSFIKSQLAIAKASVTPYSADKIISEANKMFNAEAPNLINRAVGNTMRTDDKGNVIAYTREELMQRLAPLGATKPAARKTADRQGLNVPEDPNLIGTK